MKVEKAYTFAFILYKDSISYDYDKIIDYIEKNWKHYAYICHRPDKDETKEHTHVLVHFDNKRYNSSIAKELNIGVNYIQKANLIPYLRYLIHLDDEDKIQYSIDDVYGTLKSKLSTILTNDKMSETEQVSCICDFIFESSCFLTHSILIQFVLQNGCYSAYRRNFLLFKELILENNRKF